MKSLFTLMILGLTFQGHTQQTDASKLVTLLHQQEMGFRLEMIQQYQPTDPSGKTKDSVALAQTLYTGIEAVYQKQFTAKELEDLYAFYSSPLGANLLERQSQLHSEISTVAFNWELEQQGISIDSLQLPVFNKREDELMGLNTETNGEEVAPKMEEIPLPKIEDLDDLKALIRKDPLMISDQKILLALFGQEELENLMNHQFLEEEDEQKETIKHE